MQASTTMMMKASHLIIKKYVVEPLPTTLDQHPAIQKVSNLYPI
jgi:hypothetical protein